MSKQFYFKQFNLVYVRSIHVKTVLFQAVRIGIITQFSSIWSIDRTQLVATTPGQSGPGTDGNQRVLILPQSSTITGTSPSNCLVSYPGHWLLLGGGSYPSAEVQLVYSTAPAVRAKHFISCLKENMKLKLKLKKVRIYCFSFSWLVGWLLGWVFIANQPL